SDVDLRTDIWSLGVTLYFLLTARKPFDAESLLDLMTLVVHEPPPLLQAARPEVPEGIGEAFAKCLEKERTQRYAMTAELARALAAFGSARSQALATTIVEAPAGSSPQPIASVRPPEARPATVGPEDGTLSMSTQTH